MNEYDNTLNKIMRVAGIIVMIIAIFIIWRGITTMIPMIGILYGGIFTLGGVFFLVIGFLLLVLPGSRARKKAKKEKEEAALRAKITQEVQQKEER